MKMTIYLDFERVPDIDQWVLLAHLNEMLETHLKEKYELDYDDVCVYGDVNYGDN